MKFFKQLSIFTLVGVINAGISFLIMPVLTHHLTPQDYGLLSLFNTYITILIPIVSISAYSLLGVDYYKQKDKLSFAVEFTSIQIIPFFNTAILAVLVWIFYGGFADDLELRGTGIKWGFIVLAITLFAIYYEQLLQVLIVQKKVTAFAIFSLSKVALEVALTFYFVIGRGWNWEGRMYSWLIVSVLFFLIALVYFNKQGFLKGGIRLHHIREGIVFGSPLVLHGIGKFVVNQSDRLFIVKMVSLEQAGIYNVGYTVGSLVLIAVTAFVNFFSPYLMERLSDNTERGRLQIVKISYYYIMGSVCLLMCVLIFSPLFFKFFIDPQYGDGVKYVFWVALGYCFWGGYILFAGYIFYLKKTKILGWLAIFNVITNLLFNYFFIKQFGPLGAAYATALSFFLTMLIITFIAQKLFPMPWKNFRKLKAVGL
jgi:O-antigen/teichoic acid export membrane protein